MTRGSSALWALGYFLKPMYNALVIIVLIPKYSRNVYLKNITFAASSLYFAILERPQGDDNVEIKKARQFLEN